LLQHLNQFLLALQQIKQMNRIGFSADALSKRWITVFAGSWKAEPSGSLCGA
jgi:hypothetical protein